MTIAEKKAAVLAALKQSSDALRDIRRTLGLHAGVDTAEVLDAIDMLKTQRDAAVYIANQGGDETLHLRTLRGALGAETDAEAVEMLGQLQRSAAQAIRERGDAQRALDEAINRIAGLRAEFVALAAHFAERVSR